VIEASDSVAHALLRALRRVAWPLLHWLGERIRGSGRLLMRAWLGFVFLLASLVAAVPQKTRACGGTFCDRGTAGNGGSGPIITGNLRVTVDQSGENVLFVEADGYLEAHVQIRYQGDPARFAWLVPMPEVPEVAIGSQPLFDALLASSVPSYGVRTTQMRCDGTTSTTESTGCGNARSSPSIGGTASQHMQAADMMDPIGKTVGSFDVTILQPQSSDEVLSWLMDNGFQLPERSLELVERYVAQGSVFAAVRLVPGAGVQEIHPIVFRYHGTRPSIPIQLTAVAATPDMRVRVFFLGAGRMVPSNYRHVELNQARLDWPTFVSNYETAVTRAVDETGDGHGFVTEYAGTSNVTDQSQIYDTRWDANAFLGMDPFQALAELTRQGQMDCQRGLCTFPHPLVLPLLQRYIPAPAGSDENTFYACLECARDQVDLTQWDAEAFTRDYRERVIDPATHARDLLAAAPYLTRLLTLISPDEMTADPAFHERSDLPPVARQRWAELTLPCDGPSTVQLPDGREVITTNFNQLWPSSDGAMPYAEHIDMVPLSGPLRVEIDAGAKIDKRLQVWNAQQSRMTASTNKKLQTAVASILSMNVAQQGAWLVLTGLCLAWRKRRAQRSAQ
jgi:hypothetical protein